MTGATRLTPMTQDPTGKLVAVKEAADPNKPMLVFLVFLQVFSFAWFTGPSLLT